MKRLFAIVNYESRVNENGWRIKYFWPEIVECDIETQLPEDGTCSPSKKDTAKILEYLKTASSFAWKGQVIEDGRKANPADVNGWLLAKAIKYNVYNLEGIKALHGTGSILNTLPREHQMAYQFNS